MTKFKKLFSSAMAFVLLVSMFTLAGCGGVSEEQMAQLEELRAEVNQLNQEINDLQSEKTKLTRELSEKHMKLEQCNEAKDETRDNLQKLGM